MTESYEIRPSSDDGRVEGPLEPSGRFVDLLSRMWEVGEQKYPHAPVLPIDAVVDIEHRLETALPDDFWAAVAIELSAFGSKGVESIECILQASAGARAAVADDLVPLLDLRNTTDRADAFVAVPRVAFAHRNDGPVFLVRAGSDARAIYPSFVDLLEVLVAGDLVPLHEARCAVMFAPSLGRIASTPRSEPVAPERIRHPKFGFGTVHGRTFDAAESKLSILFDDGTQRVLLARAVEPVTG